VKGKRLPDGEEPKNAGEYAWIPYSTWRFRPSFLRGEGEWHLVAPDGRIGAIRNGSHTWVEDPDGAVTFSPSLVMPSGWHGFLEHGVWREC